MIKKIVLRTFVVLFWVGLIFSILYWPSKEKSDQKKFINVFAWGDILDPNVVAEFEKSTGIKINLNFYASNEEMLVKLKATEGKGYDLIIPSDYSVEILIKEDLLQPLNKEKLNFIDRLNPRLLNHFFDPNNYYSVPFEWELFVLGIDRDFFHNRPLLPSWEMVFGNSIDYRVTMTNDPIQALLFASFYLYGEKKQVSQEELEHITQFLIQQKNHVNAYAEFRADYFLATKNSAVVIASTSYIHRTMKQFPFVDFVIPKEGTFITIENMCIPKNSRKQDLIYQLMNFLYSPRSMQQHFETYGIFPAVTEALDESIDERTYQLVSFSDPSFEKLRFIRLIANQDQIRDAWVQVKTN